MTDIIEQMERAHEVVVELCENKRKWIMHIPADPERDPDLIIGGALREAQKEIKALRSRAESAEKERDEARGQVCRAREALDLNLLQHIRLNKVWEALSGVSPRPHASQLKELEKLLEKLNVLSEALAMQLRGCEKPEEDTHEPA